MMGISDGNSLPPVCRERRSAAMAMVAQAAEKGYALLAPRIGHSVHQD